MNFKEMNIDDIYLNGTTHLPSHLLLGDLYGAYRAGMMYFYGEGVEQDLQAAE